MGRVGVSRTSRPIEKEGWAGDVLVGAQAGSVSRMRCDWSLFAEEGELIISLGRKWRSRSISPGFSTWQTGACNVLEARVVGKLWRRLISAHYVNIQAVVMNAYT